MSFTADQLARPPVFGDREDGGRRLADVLVRHELGDGVVVGLARGGVVTAAAISERLGLPLDVLAVRKVGHPAQPEYAIGAVTPEGDRVLATLLPAGEARAAVAAAKQQADALDARLHAEHPALDVSGKTVVLADDGLATGATMSVAVHWARRAGAARVVVAVPVGPPETVARLEHEADEVVCPVQPPLFGAVGFWYEDFAQVSDEEVLDLLARARRGEGAGASERALAGTAADEGS